MSTESEKPTNWIDWLFRLLTPSLLFLVLVVAIIVLATSSSGDARWEYRYERDFQETSLDRNGSDAFKQSMVSPSIAKINKLGEQGWELVSAYVENETAWPNFGKDEFVTGLQPNVRAQSLVMIFKRKI